MGRGAPRWLALAARKRRKKGEEEEEEEEEQEKEEEENNFKNYTPVVNDSPVLLLYTAHSTHGGAVFTH